MYTFYLPYNPHMYSTNICEGLNDQFTKLRGWSCTKEWRERSVKRSCQKNQGCDCIHFTFTLIENVTRSRKEGIKRKGKENSTILNFCELSEGNTFTCCLPQDIICCFFSLGKDGLGFPSRPFFDFWSKLKQHLSCLQIISSERKTIWTHPRICSFKY